MTGGKAYAKRLAGIWARKNVMTPISRALTYQTRHIKRFGNYELDLSAVPVPVSDDLTFAIEPPEGSDVVEADQEARQETDQR